MNTEEAKEFAKTMTYRDAIYNLKQARCVPYKKATFEVINRLLDELDKIEHCDDCVDCVSRQAIMELPRYSTVIGEIVYLDGIKALPHVQPKPKTGHWIMPQQDDGMSDPIYYQVRCSECGFDLDPQTWYQELHQYGADKYCPKCGRKMYEDKGVLEQLSEKQNNLLATTKAWSDAIEKNGYVN